MARASQKIFRQRKTEKKPFLQALSTDANYGCLNFVSVVLRQHMAWYIWSLKLCALVSFDSSLRGSHSHWSICHISTHIWQPAHKFAYVFLDQSTDNVFTQPVTSQTTLNVFIVVQVCLHESKFDIFSRGRNIAGQLCRVFSMMATNGHKQITWRRLWTPETCYWGYDTLDGHKYNRSPN